jgi:hypothetical protein
MLVSVSTRAVYYAEPHRDPSLPNGVDRAWAKARPPGFDREKNTTPRGSSRVPSLKEKASALRRTTLDFDAPRA